MRRRYEENFFHEIREIEDLKTFTFEMAGLIQIAYYAGYKRNSWKVYRIKSCSRYIVGVENKERVYKYAIRKFREINNETFGDYETRKKFSECLYNYLKKNFEKGVFVAPKQIKSL